MKSLSYILLLALLLTGWGVLDAQQGRANGQRNQAGTDTETLNNGAGLTQNQRTRRNSINDRFSTERQGYRNQNKGQQRTNRQNMGSSRHAQRNNMQGAMKKSGRSKYQTRQNGMRQKGSNGQGLKKGNGQGFGRGKRSI